METISYFLKRYREDMVARNEKERDIEAKLKEFEARLRAELAGEARPVPHSRPMSGPPPAPYEEQTPVLMNAIRSIRREEG